MFIVVQYSIVVDVSIYSTMPPDEYSGLCKRWPTTCFQTLDTTNTNAMKKILLSIPYVSTLLLLDNTFLEVG